MAKTPATSNLSPANQARDPLPEVRLEVRLGAARAAAYSLDHLDFLIGCVPGCDLRLPGEDLPAVLCLIARQPDGVFVRKLAPTPQLLHNGQGFTQAALNHGDRLTLGTVEIVVSVQNAVENTQPSAGLDSTAKEAFEKQVAAFRAQVVRFKEEQEKFAAEQHQKLEELGQRETQLQQREKMAPRDIAVPTPDAGAAQLADLERQKQEMAAARQELADIRKQLYDRYQERRDRLAGLQAAVDNAAQILQKRKRNFDEDEQRARQRRTEDEQRRADLDRRHADLLNQRQQLDADLRAFQQKQSVLDEEIETQRLDLEGRETQLADARTEFEARTRAYQADLVRLDRLQGTIEEKVCQAQEREQQAADKLAQLQKDGAELEQQVLELDAWRAQLQEEATRLDLVKKDQDASGRDLAQRGAALEGQQATLATLRSRLERMRDEVRGQEQQVESDRLRQETLQADLDARERRLTEREQDIAALEAQRETLESGITERQARLEAALQQLKNAQADFESRQTHIEARRADLDQRQADLEQQEGVLQGRLAQIGETQERLDLERTALRERTQSLTQAEMAREGLQEQLRQRSDDLAAKLKSVDAQMEDLEAQAALVRAQREEIDQLRAQFEADAAARGTEFEQQAASLAQQTTELAERQSHQADQFEQLKQLGKQVAEARKILAQERAAASTDQATWRQERDQVHAEFTSLKQEAIELTRVLPDLELRAGTAMDRLAYAREQLRDHLGELHAYVRQGQDELEALAQRQQTEADALHQRDAALRRAQEDHRLAMVGFRQQLIAWQGQIGDMKRLLSQDETRLQRRQAEVAQQARTVETTSQHLSRQSEELHEQQQEMVQRRQEVDRHLDDMRGWYQGKMRDLAGLDLETAAAPQPSPETVLATPPAQNQGTAEDPEDGDPLIPTARDILSLTEPTEPGDRRLGDLLRLHDLIDAATLNALLIDARRQRRSLRQALLASGVLTLYQLALIEAGQVDRLMLGPLHLIDRLRATPQETVYRVFDPRRQTEAVLRHLAEKEMDDAVRPDEFRQRFSQALLNHPHLATPLEIMELAGRPAVLEPWLTGLPASDWPPLAAAPGVCFRLFTQAALALAAAHEANLVHGHLSDGLIFLTGDGTLKIAGWGEPPWLVGQSAADEPLEPQADLRALGQIVSGWCTPSGVRRGSRAKPLPEALVSILFRLGADGDQGYTSATQLLEDLERTGAAIPANAEAWDRLLRYVREHQTPEALLRRSA